MAGGHCVAGTKMVRLGSGTPLRSNSGSGLPMENCLSASWPRRHEAHAPHRSSCQTNRRPIGGVGKTPVARPRSPWIYPYAMDVIAGGRRNKKALRHWVRSLRGLASPCSDGLELSETGTPGSRTRRRSHRSMAKKRLATYKKTRKKSGKTIVFVDESGFMLQPVVRRTWAPRGQTPIHYSWDRRDRLSVISALTVSPIRRWLGLYFDVFDHNCKADEATPFIETLREHFSKGIIRIWDRWMVHRSAAKRLERRFRKRLTIEWLPAYAPELNPVEQVWNRTTYANWANLIPQDVRHLGRAVRKSL